MTWRLIVFVNIQVSAETFCLDQAKLTKSVCVCCVKGLGHLHCEYALFFYQRISSLAKVVVSTLIHGN